ncbi:proteoglycan 4-like [Arachis ipaensis]|uniref:proteoglycan 4-like n=1 Tax=Arachis ipaensis TaxID=130454 RepID=UPI0007AEEE01|nr:proteoglycan 4-like [Arachis ipaensis]
MTLKRKSFRLRIPWPFAPIGQPSTERPGRPKGKTKSTKDSDTDVPIQRAPSPPPKPPIIEIPEKPTTTSVMIESSIPSPSKASTPYHTPQPSPSKTSTPFHTPSPSPLLQHSIVSSSPKTPPKLATQETTRPEQEEENKDVSEPKIMSIEPQDSQQQVSKTEPASNQPPTSQLPPLAEPTSETLKRNTEERTLAALPDSEEEEEKIVEAVSEFEPVPQETETKAKSPLKSIPNSPQMPTQPPDFKSQTSFKPSSPVSTTEPTFDEPPPPQLPPLAARTGEVLMRAADERTLPALPSSQGEEEKIVEAVSEFEPVPQETETKAKSPLKTIPNSPQMSTQPPDFKSQTSFKPSSPVSKTEPTFDESPPPQLPPLAARTGELLMRAADERTLPALPSSQGEKEKIVEAVSELEPVPQEFEPETSFKSSSPISKTEPTFDQPSIQESTLPPLLASQETESKAVSFHHEPTSDQSPLALLKEAELKMKSPLNTIPKLPEESSRHEMEQTTSTEKKFDLHGAAESSKPSLKPQSKLLEPQEKEKEVHEHVKARKSKGRSTSQPILHTIASSSGTKSNKDPFSEVFRPRCRTQQVVERNLMFATSKFMSSISPEKAAFHKGIVGEVSKFVHKLSTEEQTQVVTLAGENRGATMEVENLAKNEADEAEEVEPEESSQVITDMDGNTEKDLTKDDAFGMAYVNSNIQSINNSVMVHGSIT